MLYSLLSVHTQILVVCKWNLWRVRRQICTAKQNRVIMEQILPDQKSEFRVQNFICIRVFFSFPLVYNLIHLYQFLFCSWNEQNLLPHNSNKTFKPPSSNKEMLNGMKAPIPWQWCPQQAGKTRTLRKKKKKRVVIFARSSLKLVPHCLPLFF